MVSEHSFVASALRLPFLRYSSLRGKYHYFNLPHFTKNIFVKVSMHGPLFVFFFAAHFPCSLHTIVVDNVDGGLLISFLMQIMISSP